MDFSLSFFLNPKKKKKKSRSLHSLPYTLKVSKRFPDFLLGILFSVCLSVVTLPYLTLSYFPLAGGATTSTSTLLYENTHTVADFTYLLVLAPGNRTQNPTQHLAFSTNGPIQSNPEVIHVVLFSIFSFGLFVDVESRLRERLMLDMDVEA